MFKVKVDFKVVSTRLKDLKTFNKQVKNLSRLAEKMKRVIIEDNKKFALMGEDKRQRGYASLRPSTIETRAGDGPPLAPRRTNSRVVKRFYCDPVVSNGNITFRAGWRGGDVEWMKYHFTGYKHRSGRRVPARNPNGIRPETMTRLKKLASDHFKGLAKNTIRTTPNDGVAG